MKVFLVAGARPNFMKVAPIFRSSGEHEGVDCRLVHTGQHYDYHMSQAFFDDLELPEPHYFLDAGSGSHAVQTARIMTAFEELCERERPDLTMVVGDVNSTLACSVVAKKMCLQVAHVEAGLRSRDLTMPEEINRMVTDAISDLFFVTEASGEENLLAEGKPRERIHFVGNVMIDNLFHQLEILKRSGGRGMSTGELKAAAGHYVFLTLHRPANVDVREAFAEIAAALEQIAFEKTILFPVHPRTRKMMEKFELRFSEKVKLLPPLNFKESLFLWKDADVVLTDSGGLQEETTALGVPCVTLRDNTERPITLTMGTNVLGGTKRQGILNAFREALEKHNQELRVPPKWDGKAAARIWRVLRESVVCEGAAQGRS